MDAEWAVIEPPLPTDVRGMERGDDRRVLNGTYRRLRTGAPRGHIPAGYAPHTIRDDRFRRRRKRGVRDRLQDAVKVYEGDLQLIDTTGVRVH